MDADLALFLRLHRQTIAHVAADAEEQLFTLHDAIRHCMVENLPEDTTEELQEAFKRVQTMINDVQELWEWAKNQ